MSYNFLGSGCDDNLVFLFESFLPVKGVEPVASGPANCPDQLRFGFLDDSYPVLDNCERELPNFDELRQSDEVPVDVDDAIVVMKLCAVLRQRLDKVMSPPTRDGRRVPLPLDHLIDQKVLAGMWVMDISASPDVTQILQEMGAETALLDPYDQKLLNRNRPTTDKLRKEAADRLRDQVRKFTTDDQQIFDLIVADRSTIYWALVNETDSFFKVKSQNTERVISAVNKRLYTHIASLGTSLGTEDAMADCEIFVPQKISARKKTKRKLALSD